MSDGRLTQAPASDFALAAHARRAGAALAIEHLCERLGPEDSVDVLVELGVADRREALADLLWDLAEPFLRHGSRAQHEVNNYPDDDETVTLRIVLFPTARSQ